MGPKPPITRTKCSPEMTPSSDLKNAQTSEIVGALQLYPARPSFQTSSAMQAKGFLKVLTVPNVDRSLQSLLWKVAMVMGLPQ